MADDSQAESGTHEGASARRRFRPDLPLPDKHHSAGHGHGKDPLELSATVPEGAEAWPAREQAVFLFALDLFNHGYYWEAHEAWEALWKRRGRVGPEANFFQGLIKLAAAAVKASEGRPNGVRRHCQRARELWLAARQGLSDRVRWRGLAWDRLLEAADNLDARAGSFDTPDPLLLLDIVLEPADVG